VNSLEKVRLSDKFSVYTKATLSPTDYQVITLLYQPLIGAYAYTLYHTLLGLVNRQTMISDSYSHHDLESMLSIKIDLIEAHRHKLEAVGLLNVYFYNDSFLYELKSPMSAYSFVNDGILGQYLLSTLTEERYKKVLTMFKVKNIRTENHQGITKSFNEVFDALPEIGTTFESDLMNGSKAKNIKVKESDFDMRLFRESIPEGFFDMDKFDDLTRDKIINLTYIYGLDEIDMKDIYLKSIDVNLKADLSKLSALARDLYKTKTRRVATQESESEKSPVDRPSDPVEYFKVMTPKGLLEDMGSGRISSADLRTIENLIEDIKLDKGVVNVLLAYVLKIKEGKMPSYDFFEKVALNWQKDNINTVETAIDYVKHLSSQHDKSANQGYDKKRKPKSDRPDIVVPWLDDYIASLK